MCFATTIAKHILRRMIEHAILHYGERLGVRRAMGAIALPKVLDNGHWVYVENQDRKVQRTLNHAYDDLRRHHEGLADQLVSKQGILSRLKNFSGNQKSEELLEQFMEAVYYLNPLGTFREVNRSVSQYDFYIEGIRRYEAGQPR